MARVGPIQTAKRHCKTNCARDCRSYPQFPTALATCRSLCDDIYSATSAGCQDNFEECMGGCEGGATTTTVTTTTQTTTTTRR
jgi:hypothetical protein